MINSRTDIQPNSEKLIIADQKRIILTNKEGFVQHWRCPKCNDSTIKRNAIILSRPGQPGSAKRQNSKLTWIYFKNILSFCSKCQLFYVNEDDVDRINLEASKQLEQYRNICFLQPTNIKVFEYHGKPMYMLKGLPDYERNTVPDLSNPYYDLSDEAKQWICNWYYPTEGGTNTFCVTLNDHLNELLQERAGHVVKYRGTVQCVEHCVRNTGRCAEFGGYKHDDWLNYVHRYSGKRCIYQRNVRTNSSSVFVEISIEAEPYGKRAIKLDVYEEIMKIIHYQRMSPKLIKSLERNAGTGVDVYICEDQEILFDISQLMSLNYGYLY